MARFCCRLAADSTTGDQRCNFRALYVERIDGDFELARYRGYARSTFGRLAWKMLAKGGGWCLGW
jgi:hypothetical protein